MLLVRLAIYICGFYIAVTAALVACAWAIHANAYLVFVHSRFFGLSFIFAVPLAAMWLASFAAAWTIAARALRKRRAEAEPK
jgi:hypothetical protein